MATKECPIHEDIKKKLVEFPETETLLVQKSIMNPLRALKTPGAEKVRDLEAQGASLEELAPYISGKTSASGWEQGSLDEGVYPGGQVVGRIYDIPTIGELVERIMSEAEEAKKNLDSIF